jgi:hypothetical protein
MPIATFNVSVDLACPRAVVSNAQSLQGRAGAVATAGTEGYVVRVSFLVVVSVVVLVCRGNNVRLSFSSGCRQSSRGVV